MDNQANIKLLQPFMPIASYAEYGLFPQNMGFSDFDILDSSNCMERFEESVTLRNTFRQEFGYVLATDEVMQALVQILSRGMRVLDAGCGSGYLSKELVRRGVEAMAVDCQDYRDQTSSDMVYPIRTVHQIDVVADARDLVKGEIGAVLLAWPPYNNPFALDVAKAMLPGQMLINEGEPKGGNAANMDFFDYIEQDNCWKKMKHASDSLNRHHLHFSFLHDRWQVLRKCTA